MLARWQLLGAGYTDELIEANLLAARWQVVAPGVYALFTGRLSRSSQLWAAVLACGYGATLSHRTAAELHGVLDTTEPLIHVSVPSTRRVRPPAGVRIHYSGRLLASRHPTAGPPRTCVEETVLDMVNTTPDVREVVDLVTRACQRRLTTAERLRRCSDRRKKLRHRSALAELLGDVHVGAESPLEVAYFRAVERGHGLPRGLRQAADRSTGRLLRRDVCYPGFGLVVELDGAAAHPVERRHVDMARDNATVLSRGMVTLRYAWSHVMGGPCHTAVEVAVALRRGGWTGTPRRCGPSCAVRR